MIYIVDYDCYLSYYLAIWAYNRYYHKLPFNILLYQFYQKWHYQYSTHQTELPYNFNKAQHPTEMTNSVWLYQGEFLILVFYFILGTLLHHVKQEGNILPLVHLKHCTYRATIHKSTIECGIQHIRNIPLCHCMYL